MENPARLEVPRRVFDGLVVNLILGTGLVILGLLAWTSLHVCDSSGCVYSPTLARVLGLVIWLLACIPLLRAFRWWDDRRIMPERLTDRLVRSYQTRLPTRGPTYHYLQFEGGAHFTVPRWARSAVMVGDRLTVYYLPHTHEVVAIERPPDVTTLFEPPAGREAAGRSVVSG